MRSQRAARRSSWVQVSSWAKCLSNSLALSVVLNSALQVAVALVPVLILASLVIGGTPFTLAIPPILTAALLLAVLVVTIVTVDGEADTVDGAALVGLYVIVAAIFWWG